MYYLFKIKIWGWRRGSTHKQEAYLNPPVCLCRSLSAVGPRRCLTLVIPRHPCGIVHVLQRRDLGSSWMTEGCNIQKLGRTRSVGWLLSWVFPITSYSFFLRGGSALGFKVTVTTVTSRDSVNFRVKSELYLRGMCHVKAFTLTTYEVTYLVDLFPYAGENWERGRKQVWRPVLTRWKKFILDSWKLGMFLISFFSIGILGGGLC